MVDYKVVTVESSDSGANVSSNIDEVQIQLMPVIQMKMLHPPSYSIVGAHKVEVPPVKVTNQLLLSAPFRRLYFSFRIFSIVLCLLFFKLIMVIAPLL